MNAEKAIDFQISLEERISRIYRNIGDHFSPGGEEDKEWGEFWSEMSTDEANHASLLSIEKAFLHSGTHLKSPLEIDPKGQKALDRFLLKCEERIQFGLTQKEAIEILTSLEGWGESDTYASLLKATDSKVLDHVADFSLSHKVHEKRVKDAILRYGNH